ncbi:equilibrative nucleoside transporter 3 isoform X2 [Anabrus simplex]|uniref:equilibrative nucleoside transporter 3 isoform X2 n=1 Tax=Anabrus simplex TaxID=316456 RepID=UPI0035A28EEA
MNQSASFSNSKPSGPENQFLLNETVPKNGSTPRGTRKNVDFHEKQPLFERPSEPVRLTPAWEETNLPNDELNFKSVTMEQVDMEMNPPTDRLKLVYFTLLIHGVGTLMPWNMFINAKAYFVHYKLAKVYTGVDSEYARNFLPYVGFAAQIPNLLFNWLNIFVQMGGNLTTRIVWSIIVEVCVFIFTVTLAMSDSSSWPGVFFWLTMVTVVILNMANGIYQNTVFGMAAKLPFKYTGAVILGANISGTFSSLISILSLAMAPNPRTAAIYYFITALFVLLACFDTYFALPLNCDATFFESELDSSFCSEDTSEDSGAASCDDSTISPASDSYWGTFSGLQKHFLFTRSPGLKFPLSAKSQPVDFCRAIVNDDIINMMVHETNENARNVLQGKRVSRWSRFTQWTDINCGDMKKFLGLLMWMGLAQFPKLHNY